MVSHLQDLKVKSTLLSIYKLLSAVVRQCELEYTKYPRLGVIKLDKLNVGSISVDCFSWWTINRKGKVGGMTYNHVFLKGLFLNSHKNCCCVQLAKEDRVVHIAWR